MKFVSNNNITDPTINLAMEEYVLKYLPVIEFGFFLFFLVVPSAIMNPPFVPALGPTSII